MCAYIHLRSITTHSRRAARGKSRVRNSLALFTHSAARLINSLHTPAPLYFFIFTELFRAHDELKQKRSGAAVYTQTSRALSVDTHKHTREGAQTKVKERQHMRL